MTNMNNIDLERAKKLIKTKKDEGDFQSLSLLMEAQQTKDFSKWQKFIVDRANKKNRKDMRKYQPMQYYFTWFCRIVLFPLWVVIIIDKLIKLFKK